MVSEEKRILYDYEVEELLEDLQLNGNIPFETATSILEAAKNSIRKQHKTLKVYPSSLPILKQIITREYMKALIEPATQVGMLTALNLGSLYTQSVVYSTIITIRRINKD